MPQHPDRRPDPEELLRRVQAEERRQRLGRLKVFLGYAPRVGKSYRMFAEGRRRAERGEDVVVGAVQGQATPEIQEILSRLETIPPVIERHAGRIYEVMDLAAIFRRQAAATRSAGRTSATCSTAASPSSPPSTSSTSAKSRPKSSASPANGPPTAFPKNSSSMPTRSKWWTRRPTP
jgi:hypothetical protein